jgi:hypothetical protein
MHEEAKTYQKQGKTVSYLSIDKENLDEWLAACRA